MKAYMSTWTGSSGKPMGDPLSFAYPCAEVIARNPASQMMAVGEATIVLTETEPAGGTAQGDVDLLPWGHKYRHTATAALAEALAAFLALDLEEN